MLDKADEALASATAPLDAIDRAVDADPQKTKSPTTRERHHALIPVDSIVPCADNRPIDAAFVEALAASIREVGLEESIHVIARPDGKHELVNGGGHHRYHAHVLLKAKTIPALVDSGDPAIVRKAALHAAMLRRDLSYWDQFVAVLRRRKQNAEARVDESLEDMATATRIHAMTLRRLLAVQDWVDTSLWETLKGNPHDWEMLGRLDGASRLGRDKSDLERRDLQVAWWAKRGWEPKIPKKKKPPGVRQRRPKRNEIRNKIVSIDPDDVLRGARVRQLLAWSMGETLEASIALAKPREKQRRRSIANTLADALKKAS